MVSSFEYRPSKKEDFFILQRHPVLERFIRLFATHCFEIRMSKLLFIFLQKTQGLHRIGWESRRGVTVDGWLARLRELLNQFFPNSSQFQHLADAMERNGQPPRDMVAMFLIYFVLFLPDEHSFGLYDNDFNQGSSCKRLTDTSKLSPFFSSAYPFVMIIRGYTSVCLLVPFCQLFFCKMII